jgi:hypothetical protein
LGEERDREGEGMKDDLGEEGYDFPDRREAKEIVLMK